MSTAAAADRDTAVLAAVERRVLWLATAIVHHANRVRETRSGVKVGGHQASSASCDMGRERDRAPVSVTRSRACPPIFGSGQACPRRTGGIA